MSETRAAICAVHTPPENLGRGYAGTATAALVERIMRRGKSRACLHTDLANPYANRCYRKVGFKTRCRSRQVDI